ncbi:cytochrome P450 [Actinoplanes sp. NPDC051861]|uniref:cytochrome P450 n=1 Tax=Actinoplanes sp. NPDC051861 TaxID=3155170 RepID=UPI00341BDB3A
MAMRAHAYRGDPAARILARPLTSDPYPIYEQARAAGLVTRSSLGPLFVTASHRVVGQALRDPRLGVLTFPYRLTDTVQPVEDSFLMKNPPDHTRLRRLVAPWFTGRAIQQRRTDVARVVDRTLDDLAGRPGFDVVQDFALPVAVRVICDLIGLPEGHERRLAGWGAMLSLSLDRVRTLKQRRRMQDSLADMDRFFAGVIERGEAPSGSVLAALMDTAGDPQMLTRRDVVATSGLLLLAGFETVVGLIGSAAWHLLHDRELRVRALGDPAMMTGLVEETLRHEPPVQYTIRRVNEPYEVDGVQLPRNSQILLLLAAASRDPDVFENPQRFLPTRPNSRDHLAFSGGVHYCIGAGLARMEAEVALGTLFRRLPGLAPGGEPGWYQLRNLRSLRTLPVTVGGDPSPSDHDAVTTRRYL